MRQCRETVALRDAYADFASGDRPAKRRRTGEAEGEAEHWSARSAGGAEDGAKVEQVDDDGAAGGVDVGTGTEIIAGSVPRIAEDVADVPSETLSTASTTAAEAEPEPKPEVMAETTTTFRTPPSTAPMPTPSTSTPPSPPPPTQLAPSKASAQTPTPVPQESPHPHQSLQFYLVPPRGPAAPRPLAARASLAEALAGATVLEFPTIRVVRAGREFGGLGVRAERAAMAAGAKTRGMVEAEVDAEAEQASERSAAVVSADVEGPRVVGAA